MEKNCIININKKQKTPINRKQTIDNIFIYKRVLINFIIYLLLQNSIQMQSKQQLNQKILSLDAHYQGLIQKVKPFRFVISGSGCREHAQVLPPALYRVVVYSTLFALDSGQSIAFMITASHNPANDNGIKIGYLSDNVIPIQVYKNLEQCLNNKQKFQTEITNYLTKIQEKATSIITPIFFLGRDVRPSSPQLSKIVQQVFSILSVKYIDIGVCTTPELYSFARYLVMENLVGDIHNLEDLSLLKQKYVKKILVYFENIYDILLMNHLTKQKILIDLSNGSGGISILPYLQILQKYFVIQLINDKQFNNTNKLCGADYISRNWSKVLEKRYVGYDEIIFFDGDSDRIIIKMASNDQCFDGNYFLMLYIKTFVKIMKELKDSHVIDGQQFQFNGVSTFMMNLGVKAELNEIGVECLISDIGIQNVFIQALKSNKISVFFQPNGHGGVYFSDSIIHLLKQKLQKYSSHISLKLLNTFYEILQNNSRGYGLHNMLMFFICKKYLGITNLQELFCATHEKSLNVFVKNQFSHCFRNGIQRDNQLVEPHNIVRIIQNITENNKKYLITVRKSGTQKGLVRLSVQGQDKKKCQQIIESIKKALEDFEYIQKYNHQTH